MDSTSDSESEDILELCKELNIKVPLKKQKLRNVYIAELENIDINNLPIEILPEFLPISNETASELNKELSQYPVTLAAEIEETVQNFVGELSQAPVTVPRSCEELPQNVVLEDPASHLDASVFNEIAPCSFQEQPTVSTTTANPPFRLEMQSSDDEYGGLNSNRKRSINGFADSKKWDKSKTREAR
uniref:Uncharacterized protein n=1 Tax=Heliothis virescens TaxID=7102 RepID=A0A2A4JWD4_HELVI